MAHFYALFAMTFVPFVVGVVMSIFVHRVPRRGWIGVFLILLSGLFWCLIQPSDTSATERLWALSCFTFFSPIAVIYAFRSRKAAPDRLLANAAFVGSFVVSAALLFMLIGWVYMAFTIIASPNKSLQPTRGGALGSSRSRGLFCIAVPAWLSSSR